MRNLVYTTALLLLSLTVFLTVASGQQGGTPPTPAPSNWSLDSTDTVDNITNGSSGETTYHICNGQESESDVTASSPGNAADDITIEPGECADYVLPNGKKLDIKLVKKKKSASGTWQKLP